MSKPLTKALHTVRVIEVMVELAIRKSPSVNWTADAVLAAVYGQLGNAEPTDPTLAAQCKAKATKVIGELIG